MSDPVWAWRLGFALLAVAGVAVVTSAALVSGGDLLGEVTVRGGTVPVVLVVTVGAAVAFGGIVGFLGRRG